MYVSMCAGVMCVCTRISALSPFLYTLTEERQTSMLVSFSLSLSLDDDEDDVVACCEKRKVKHPAYTLVTSCAMGHSDQVCILRNVRGNRTEPFDPDPLLMAQRFELRLSVHTNCKIPNSRGSLRQVDKKPNFEIYSPSNNITHNHVIASWDIVAC